MLPTLHLTKETSSTSHRPPKNFTPAGRVDHARFMDRPPSFIRPGKASGKKQAGILYERKVQEYLLARYPCYIPGPWLCFNQDRYCQPNGS